ncbi:hypothetical protein Baya_12767 [Bagarius yarrelli]|uniref:Uncharacterized protein n=1 Tax=Bagarius yarrelli TaxID=175774 RepID=A0A556V3T6_BAGYA|nr:hypothetical protein Baya_12767 [Bagarius yarrelli]
MAWRKNGLDLRHDANILMAKGLVIHKESDIDGGIPEVTPLGLLFRTEPHGQIDSLLQNYTPLPLGVCCAATVTVKRKTQKAQKKDAPFNPGRLAPLGRTSRDTEHTVENARPIYLARDGCGSSRFLPAVSPSQRNGLGKLPPVPLISLQNISMPFKHLGMAVIKLLPKSTWGYKSS